MREITGKCPLGSECLEQKEINGEKTLVRCPWHVKLRGKDPQSENEIDEYRCAIAWMPILQIEHSLFERQTGAATEQVRNAIVGLTAQAKLARDEKRITNDIRN